MDAIESKQISEAITLKDVNAAVAGKNNEQDRANILNDLAWKNNLPGLYDPVSGYFIAKQSQPVGGYGQGYNISATGSKDADTKLAQLGLVPKNAKTSSALGKFFGTSGDEYDKQVQTANQEVIAKQEREELIKTSTAKLAELLKKLVDTLGQEKKFKDAVAAQIAKQTAGQAAKPTQTKESTTSIAASLVESFGYKTEQQTDEGIGAAVGKLGARALPGVGLALGASDAWDRIKAGDYTGAALAGVGGVAGLVPGVGTAAQLGLMGVNAGRDKARTGSFFPGEDEIKMAVARDQGSQAAKPSASANKLQQLQKIIGATPDGIMGPETKSKLQAWQQKQGISADGMPGPETYAKAGIKENKSMKSLAEQIKDLQQKLESLDQPIDEYYVDEDNNFYNSLGEQIEMDEGIWDNIVKGGAKLFKGIGQGFKNPGVRNIPNLSTAQRVGANVGTVGNKVAKGGKAVTDVVSKNPAKSTAAAAAGGAALGYGLSGGDQTGGSAGGAAKPTTQSGSSTGSGTSNTAEPEQPQPQPVAAEEPASPEVQAIVDEIRKLVADMSKIDDPAIKQAVDSANQTINSIPGLKSGS